MSLWLPASRIPLAATARSRNLGPALFSGALYRILFKKNLDIALYTSPVLATCNIIPYAFVVPKVSLVGGADHDDGGEALFATRLTLSQSLREQMHVLLCSCGVN